MAEVAGVRPAEPGWAAIEFKPRLSLYAELEARVPMRMVDGKTTGVVHVRWVTSAARGIVEVRFRLDIKMVLLSPCTYNCPGIAHA